MKDLGTSIVLDILYNHEDLQGGHDDYWLAYRFVEKSLKALEIIKETPEFAWYVKIYKDAYEMLADVKGFRVNESVEELQKKFDLLKEVLL